MTGHVFFEMSGNEEFLLIIATFWWRRGYKLWKGVRLYKIRCVIYWQIHMRRRHVINDTQIVISQLKL